MFEAIAFKNSPGHRELIDIGALAEALIFYGRVAIVGNSATIDELLKKIPPFILLRLMQDKRLQLHYLSDQCGVSTTKANNNRQLHTLIKFSSPEHTIEKIATKSFLNATGTNGQAKIGARRFTGLIMPLDHATFDQTSVLNAMLDPTMTEASINSMLRVAAPKYEQAEQLRFRLERENQSFYIDTNILFDRLNTHYHQLVPSSHSSMSEAYLLALLQGAFEATYFGAALEAEIAVSQIEKTIHSETVKSLVSRHTQSEQQIDRFLDLTLENAHAIREAVNSGAISFSAVVKLLDSADKFRHWIHTQPADADLLHAYYQETIKNSWVERLPGKTTRWGVFTGIGIGADAIATGGLGVLAGVGISAFDAFILDKLISGWKPHQFVEGDLRPTIQNEKPKNKT